MARATGAGAYSRNSLGVVIASGMLVSTVLGRFVIPIYYVLGERISQWFKAPRSGRAGGARRNRGGRREETGATAGAESFRCSSDGHAESEASECEYARDFEPPGSRQGCQAFPDSRRAGPVVSLRTSIPQPVPTVAITSVNAARYRIEVYVFGCSVSGRPSTCLTM